MTRFDGFVAGAVLAATLLLAAGAAHAQACGSIPSQPEDVYDTFVSQLGLALPVGDSSVCDKLTKAAVSACHKAVSDTASCLTSLSSSVYKGTKPVCSTFKNQSGCLDDAKAVADGDKSDFAAMADTAHAECDDAFEAAIQQACMLGFPM